MTIKLIGDKEKLSSFIKENTYHLKKKGISIHYEIDTQNNSIIDIQSTDVEQKEVKPNYQNKESKPTYDTKRQYNKK